MSKLEDYQIYCGRTFCSGALKTQSICSNMLELYKSRDEITVNEKWRQELSRLHDDCAVALHKYELTSAR
jgi:hypothetical protein